MDSATQTPTEKMDYWEGRVMLRPTVILKFKVARKHRRRVRKAVKNLTHASMQEYVTFRDSTFVLIDVSPHRESNLRYIKDMFQDISI